ncbi:universal stress protein [Candidatus Uabimicrobium amorphum]|uniref:Universal stress protein n=1 Tax=Uabimicrobium amorphum TaxID=2596890 RepID=A0A5S9IW00_UABAM|nr:universal stress protein [Candidatus Uabimicrobium amorphum]BBM88110.1 universal stress protein [Candidatus Uabimicrobium amorphum]
MSEQQIHQIFHPTDLSKTSDVAFAHALKLSLIGKAELDILHVGENVDTNSFPKVLKFLERWSYLPPGSTKADILKLGCFVRKIAAPSSDPFSWIMDYLKTHHPDLIVLLTHQKKGITRWIKKSISEPIARKSKAMTLFIPDETTGFVSVENGYSRLKHILVPVTSDPSPQIAMKVASKFAEKVAKENQVRFTLLFVGDLDDKPVIPLPNRNWEIIIKNGNVVEKILQVAKFKQTDLITMTTKGHDGFLDALRGSTTEQVIREALVPVLAIPATRKKD